MNDQDYGQFVAIWSQSYELYNKNPSDGAIEMAFNVLKRFDLEQIKRGLTAHMNDPQQGQFPPKPADVVRQVEGDADSRALTAWSRVDDAIRTVGPYQTVVFDDRITMQVVEDMGGWIDLCSIPNERELEFKRNEFTKRYQGYITRPPQEFPAKLIGVDEWKNAEFPEFKPEPKLIGDQERALAIHRCGSETRKQITPLGQAVQGLQGRLEGQGEQQEAVEQ